MERQAPIDLTGDDLARLMMNLEEVMHEAAKDLRFDDAAVSETRSTNSDASYKRWLTLADGHGRLAAHLPKNRRLHRGWSTSE